MFRAAKPLHSPTRPLRRLRLTPPDPEIISHNVDFRARDTFLAAFGMR